jgi:hypothetical protein
MGYTLFTKQLVQKVLVGANIQSVIDLGSCNDYDIGGDSPPFISDWYATKRINYTCIDLAGDNNALRLDLSNPLFPIGLPVADPFDLVVDAGTSEHVVQSDGYEKVSFHEGHINSVYPSSVKNIEAGYYNCWLNKFNLCKEGGYIISENPKTNNWPGHGYTYVDFNTYWQLSRVSELYIVEIGEHPASGNHIDGMNIWCIMKKVGNHFPTFEKFQSSVQVYKK